MKHLKKETKMLPIEQQTVLNLLLEFAEKWMQKKIDNARFKWFWKRMLTRLTDLLKMFISDLIAENLKPKRR